MYKLINYLLGTAISLPLISLKTSASGLIVIYQCPPMLITFVNPHFIIYIILLELGTFLAKTQLKR